MCGWRSRTRLKITKPYCRGIARLHQLAERATHFEVAEVYGALRNKTSDIAANLINKLYD